MRGKFKERSRIFISGSNDWTLAITAGAAATLQSRFARQLPLHRGAFVAEFTLPFCWTRVEIESAAKGQPQGSPLRRCFGMTVGATLAVALVGHGWKPKKGSPLGNAA